VTTPDKVIRFLSQEECRALLEEVKVARVAVVVNGVPQVVPVNHVVLDGDVVFRTGSGTKLAAALLQAPVSVEVDKVDEEAMTGWSVLVSGRASVVTDPAVLTRLDGLDLVTWAPGPRDDVVRVQVETISGRAVERA